MRTAVLKVGAPCSANQQTVARESHRFIVEYETDAAIRMTRRCAHLKMTRTERNRIAVTHIAVRAFRATRRRYRNLTAGALFQQPRARHMIRVNVRVDRTKQAKAQLVEQRCIAARLFEYRV